MMQILSVLFLVAGASLCLIAAVGVLRLPDFFMRMHSATKAGVAGSGLVLIGVAFSEPSVSMWVKVAIAVAFLILTTPIAGHLLGRAGYVSGVRLWRGTIADDLAGILPRGDFDKAIQPKRRAQMKQNVERVILAMAAGDAFEGALRTSLELAREHGAKLTALAIIDTPRLHKIGPVPVGGNYYAKQLRGELTAKARRKVADAIEALEQAAARQGVEFAVKLEEGDPQQILRSELSAATAFVLPRDTWFDQGLASPRVDPALMLRRYGLAADATNGDSGPIVLYL